MILLFKNKIKVIYVNQEVKLVMKEHSIEQSLIFLCVKHKQEHTKILFYSIQYFFFIVIGNLLLDY